MLNKNTRCFTSYNERGLMVWNPETLETLFKREFSEQVTCVCYSTKFHLYFVCTRKLQLKVLNEYLNVVEELPLKIRLV
jgi:hypothetical protein